MDNLSRNNNLINQAWDYIKMVISQFGDYQLGEKKNETNIDVIKLQITKLYDDLNAVFLLIDNKYFIQAGNLGRSIDDTCIHLMESVFSVFEDKNKKNQDIKIINKWLVQGYKSTQNIARKHKININHYKSIRDTFNKFEHGNYEIVKYYPYQLDKTQEIENEDFIKNICSWHKLIEFYIYSCVIACAYLDSSDNNVGMKIIEDFNSTFNIK